MIPFFGDGVLKFVGTHRKTPRHVLQARPGGANYPCACASACAYASLRERMRGWLNLLSVLPQAMEFAKKIESSSRPISAG